VYGQKVAYPHLQAVKSISLIFAVTELELLYSEATGAMAIWVYAKKTKTAAAFFQP